MIGWLTHLFRLRQVRHSQPVRLSFDDAVEMATVHRLGFARGWSSAEFESLLLEPNVLAYGHKAHATLTDFVLMRVAAQEAEVLTLVTHPDWRGLGLALRTLRLGLHQAALQGALTCFLEVNDGNASALRLYQRQGFVCVGRRKGYYANEGGGDALVMSCRLTHLHAVMPPPDVTSIVEASDSL